jgi:glycosyltransferase involved in cell wall biosynthesis
MQLTQYDWLIRFMDAAQGQLSRFADLMICNSYAGLKHVQASGSRARRAIAIPNGIDTDRYRPNPTARREIRREWGIATDERVVGLVGRLDPMKGHPTFLSAAAKIIAECTRVRFVCISQGPEDYGHQLKELANSLGISERITWSSGRDDMPAVYPAFDVLVSASIYGEGFPNVVGEAMACGVPCVVTDVGDSAIVVGDQGEVVPTEDPDVLSAAILRTIARIDGHLNDSKAIRSRIVETFPVSSMVDRTEAALLELMQPPSRN